ncbi:HNH endonuclease [Streptomyces katsurahamanus]|uniref:HNH endonuclease n=1 Tax=Streptomyces katsurahamanus TaxID=2577098 RepID=A0ABW9P264_9ACTN|nr:HNH endonuclease [Streptomyces katsurahamanus]
MKPADQFLAGKAKRPSSTCATCRGKLAAQHRRKFYAKLSTDDRHTLTHRRRAKEYGTEHEAYSRTAILARWLWKCAYCDAPAEHLDHVVPLAKGGADREENMVPACAPCNLSKGAKTLEEWGRTMLPPPPPF